MMALLLGTARADDTAHTHTVLPGVTFEGGPGKTKLELGLDILVGVAPEVDLRIAPKFQATASDGVSTIFSADNAGFAAGGAWQLGGTFSIINLRSLKDLPHDLLPSSVQRDALVACIAECDASDANGKDAFCNEALKTARSDNAKKLAPALQAVTAKKAAVDAAQTTLLLAKAEVESATATEAADSSDRNQARKKKATDAAKAALDDLSMKHHELETERERYDDAKAAAEAALPARFQEELDPSKMCKNAQEKHVEYSRIARDVRLQWPERVISFGILLGQTRHKFLEIADPETMAYRLAKPRSYPKLSFGVSYLRIRKDVPITLEAAGRLDSTWESPSKTVEWCVPSVMVQRPGGGGLDEAKDCDEQTLGKPTVTRSLKASAYMGVVDPKTSGWRLAVGPTLKYKFINKADDEYELGFEAPLYFRLAILKQSLSFIARVTPSMVMTHASDGTEDAKFLLTVAILGDRTMFPGALE